MEFFPPSIYGKRAKRASLLAEALFLVFPDGKKKGFSRLLTGSKRMLSLFEDFELQPNGTQIDRVESFKYLGVTTDAKWSWKPHISNLLKKLGHRLSLFNTVYFIC